MAKGKYQEWTTSDGLLLVEGWARNGLTDEQIAQNIGITCSTLYAWENRFPEFLKAIKKGKVPADNFVENALYKRAIGFKYTETKTEITEDGKQKVTTTTKSVPPDVGAIAFWLKNRKPDVWREKREEIISISEADPDLIDEVERIFNDKRTGD